MGFSDKFAKGYSENIPSKDSAELSKKHTGTVAQPTRWFYPFDISINSNESVPK
jgi:hypothetical protein